MIPTKTCKDCGETKQIVEFPLTGRVCRVCASIRTKEWKRANPEKTKEQLKRWKAKNPKKAQQYAKDYYQRKKQERAELLARIAELEGEHDRRPDPPEFDYYE